MKYELKKLICRTETLVLLVLSVIALVALGMRGSNTDKARARLSREITAQYAGMPDTEAAQMLKQEMEERCEGYDVKVAVIEKDAYAHLNGDKALDQVLALFGE